MQGEGTQVVGRKLRTLSLPWAGRCRDGAGGWRDGAGCGQSPGMGRSMAAPQQGAEEARGSRSDSDSSSSRAARGLPTRPGPHLRRRGPAGGGLGAERGGEGLGQGIGSAQATWLMGPDSRGRSCPRPAY